MKIWMFNPIATFIVVIWKSIKCGANLSTHTKTGINTSSIDLREYCQWETFEAECAEDEVVVMTSALYGRMKIGRCIKHGRDDVGCSADVRGLADARCSGRQKCQIAVPDKLFDGTMPCHEELKLYLMASYQCLKVLQPRRNSCSNQIEMTSHDKEIHLKDGITTPRSGFISSWISSKTGCGSPQTPWTISLSHGQRINLTIIDFASNSSAQGSNQESLPGLHSPCQVLAVIKEITPGKSKTVCSDPYRKERFIYESEGHQVEVRVILPNIARDGGHFLIRYEAVGCENLITPEKGWWQRSKGNPNLSTVGCFDTKKTWSLVCQANKWVGGQPKECLGSGSFFQTFASADFFVPNLAAIMVVLCIAFLVGAFIFLAGLCYIRKQRRILQSKKLIQERCDTYNCKPDKLPQEIDFLHHGNCDFPPPQNFEENDYAYVDELLQVHGSVPIISASTNTQQIPQPPPAQALKTCVEMEQNQHPKHHPISDLQQHHQQYRSNNKFQDEIVVSSFTSHPTIHTEISQLQHRSDNF